MTVDYSNNLRISFNYTHGIIRVYKAVLLALDNPKYVFFTWNEETKTIAVHGTDELNVDCLLVSRHLGSKASEGLRLNGQEFIRRIGTFVGWDITKRYRVSGHLSENGRSVVFDLSKAEST